MSFSSCCRGLQFFRVEMCSDGGWNTSKMGKYVCSLPIKLNVGMDLPYSNAQFEKSTSNQSMEQASSIDDWCFNLSIRPSVATSRN